MSLLSWNFRGLARGQAIRALRALFKQNDRGVAFLMETKISDEALSHTVRNLGFFSFVSSPPLLASRVGSSSVGAPTSVWLLFLFLVIL